VLVGGENDERAVLERTIEADRLYVMDRGYAKFALFNRIVGKDIRRSTLGLVARAACCVWSLGALRYPPARMNQDHAACLVDAAGSPFRGE